MRVKYLGYRKGCTIREHSSYIHTYRKYIQIDQIDPNKINFDERNIFGSNINNILRGGQVSMNIS